MSLYDGIDIDDRESGRKNSKPEIAGWGSGHKLLQSHKELQAKKASLLNLKKKQSRDVAPVVDLRSTTKKSIDPNELHFNLKTGKLERVHLAVTTLSPFINAEMSSSLLGITDEYDPLCPNDYDQIIKTRKAKDKEDERKKEIEERERRRRERHREQGLADADSDHDEELPRKSAKVGGAAIAPPPSLIEQDQQGDSPVRARDEYGSPLVTTGLGGSVVSKMMARMGYKEGLGLGRNKQGMSTALMVEKTSKRGGKIIHEKDIPKVMELPTPPPPQAMMPPPPPQTNTNLMKNPSKVMLLRNMVGPGEVDEELEGETKEECLKYGKIIKCMIFEIPGVPEDEAVRIFLEFEKVDSAIKAVIDLNGRFFGGRTVKAGFYNLDKFRRLDLGDEVE